MNKKGALFHWFIFGILAALGLFLMLTIDFDAGVKVKGQWHHDFLEKNYLQAEKELLALDLKAKNSGDSILTAMANNGGFEDISGCGEVNNINLWNKNSDSCFPNVNDVAIALVRKELADFSGFNFDSNKFSGETVAKTISSDLGSYTYNSNFNVKLTHSLDEYALLFRQSLALIKECQNKADLENCLADLKPANWFFSSCQNEDYFVEDNKVTFCVLGNTGLSYNFGLDFNVADYDKLVGLR